MLTFSLALLTAAGAALAPGPAGAADGARWAWPLDPAPAVVRGFDEVGRYAAGHRGVDLAAGPGQTVRAPAPGRVTFAGSVAGRGVLVLTHADGVRSSYEPVDPTVAVGAQVAAGDAVATVSGTVAHCPATCLHVGLRAGAGHDVRYLDPLAWFTLAGPPVLLPLDGTR